MTVKGPAFCFKCDKVVITKLKESTSSEAKFHSVGAEIRDKLSPGSPILLGRCSICHGAVGRFGYDDCEYEDHESKYAGAPYDQTIDEEKIRKAFDRQDKLAKKKCSWGMDGCDCMQECCNECGRLVDNDSAKIFKDYGICRKCHEDEPNIDEEKIRKSLRQLEENESAIDKELEKRNLTDYWDEVEKRRTEFKNKISDIDILKYRKPDGGIDWDKYHEERRRRKDCTKKTEFSDEDKEELR